MRPSLSVWKAGAFHFIERLCVATSSGMDRSYGAPAACRSGARCTRNGVRRVRHLHVAAVYFPDIEGRPGSALCPIVSCVYSTPRSTFNLRFRLVARHSGPSVRAAMDWCGPISSGVASAECSRGWRGVLFGIRTLKSIPDPSSPNRSGYEGCSDTTYSALPE